MTPSAREGMTPGWGAETPRDARAFEDVKVTFLFQDYPLFDVTTVL